MLWATFSITNWTELIPMASDADDSFNLTRILLVDVAFWLSTRRRKPLIERHYQYVNWFVSQDFPSCLTDNKTCRGNSVQWSKDFCENKVCLDRNASGKPQSIHTSWLTGGNTVVGVQTERVTDLFVSENKSWNDWNSNKFQRNVQETCQHTEKDAKCRSLWYVLRKNFL